MNFSPVVNDESKNYYNQFQNGRVVDITKTNYKKFPVFPNNNNNNNSFKNEALKGIQQDSTLSFLFFSKDNMRILQDLLRYQVWLQSGKKWVIGDQSNIELEIVMRSIYLQYSENLNCKFREQINKLNNMVADYCVPTILAEVQQYLGYLDNVQNLPNPIALPENLSSAGTKTLRSVTTTF
jgi:hypothetical protein